MKKDKVYRKITKKRLGECLDKIGWSFKNGGCDFYYLKDHKGNITNFRIRSENENDTLHNILLDNTENLCCSFQLDGCSLRVDGDGGCICIMVNKNKNHNQPAFINFYNFDKRYKK